MKSAKLLAKFLEYVLGRKPDEFGLTPGPDGWITIKDLLQALNEEEGWRHVRQASLNEILLSEPSPPFEIENKRIRALDRTHLPGHTYAESPPKLLYTGITRKSYPAVLEKGITPTRHPQVILCADQPMAERIAKRRDPAPILLTVNTDQAAAGGAVFYQTAESLFTAEFIPPGSFMGPPLPKQKEPPPKKQKPDPLEKQRMAGTFVMNIPGLPAEKKERKKAPAGSWKRDKKRIRREKQKNWPE